MKCVPSEAPVTETGKQMTSILKRVKRTARASFQLAPPKAQPHAAYLMDREPMPDDRALASFAALAQQYRPNVLSVTQDLSELEAHYSK